MPEHATLFAYSHVVFEQGLGVACFGGGAAQAARAAPAARAQRPLNICAFSPSALARGESVKSAI
jgi:hypothetical protein